MAGIGIRPVKSEAQSASTVYPSMIVVKSKMYACLNLDGVLETKALSTVRSNTPLLQTRYTRDLLAMSVRAHGHSSLVRLVHHMRSSISTPGHRFRMGTVPVPDIATPTRRGGRRTLEYMGINGARVEVSQSVVDAHGGAVPMNLVNPDGQAYAARLHEFCCTILGCFGYSRECILTYMLPIRLLRGHVTQPAHVPAPDSLPLNNCRT